MSKGRAPHHAAIVFQVFIAFVRQIKVNSFQVVLLSRLRKCEMQVGDSRL